MIPKNDHEKRLALYNQGLNDREIGERLYLTSSAIAFWRRVNGLPAHNTYRRITPEIDAEMREIHRAGKSDLVISKKFGMNKNTVYSWRRRNGLPANFKRGGAPDT